MRVEFFKRALLPHGLLACIAAGLCPFARTPPAVFVWGIFLTAAQLLCWYWTDVLLTDRTPGERMIRAGKEYVGSDGQPHTDPEGLAWLLLGVLFALANWVSLAACRGGMAAMVVIVAVDLLLFLVAASVSNPYAAFVRHVYPRLEVRFARIAVEQFYAAHRPLLAEHLPADLLCARLNAAIPPDAEPTKAWQAARKLLERLHTLAAQAREVLRLDEERRRQAEPPDPDPRVAARAVIHDVVAELRMGLPPDVIARSLEATAGSETLPRPRVLTADDLTQPPMERRP